MKFKMLKNRIGCPDGITQKIFEKDKIYESPNEISNFLASGWLKQGICEEVIEKPVAANRKNKKINGVTEKK